MSSRIVPLILAPGRLAPDETPDFLSQLEVPDELVKSFQTADLA
ncbi:hypothetical protein [Rhizobium rhizogenes]|nr:hypothetical protein [Rhizobium rhizogenes]